MFQVSVLHTGKFEPESGRVYLLMYLSIYFYAGDINYGNCKIGSPPVYTNKFDLQSGICFRFFFLCFVFVFILSYGRNKLYQTNPFSPLFPPLYVTLTLIVLGDPNEAKRIQGH